MTGISIPIGQIGDYEIKQLKIFKTVVDCGGFSAAETELNISRSTISIHISNLEARLNLTLCRRGRAGFSLTDEGAVVYDATIKLLGELEDFRGTINNLDSSMTGKLNLAFSDTISLDHRAKIPRTIERFSKLASEVHITAEVARMTEIERMVMNEEADIGFIPYHRSLDGLNYRHLYSDACYLYCAEGNPLFPLNSDELTDEIINSTPAVHAGFKAHDNINIHLAQMNQKATAYNYESRLALILSSRLIGFLPEHYAQNYVDSGQLKVIDKGNRFYKLDIMAITRNTSATSKIRDRFMQVLQSIF
ncbi:LysR family transcriptional regulator [Endozoicomonas sp. OPT23]|uniref:LysR family transcriptional regulator n=1 Tax=Endozoicomonas sp. OPT23 TaxID=2072845 RepID=UPI00129A3C84|nr:LysR family transcriptional regulator [Endozoicomonas sp. OPT23]MRI34843.1 LysR family transcriptional regulator [Endozoicomonas sp. OPT23]